MNNYLLTCFHVYGKYIIIFLLKNGENNMPFDPWARCALCLSARATPSMDMTRILPLKSKWAASTKT